MTIYRSHKLVIASFFYMPLTQENEPLITALYERLRRDDDQQGDSNSIVNENGEKLPLPGGDYNSRKERTTDWDDRGNCKLWRTAWANTTNRYLERAGEDVRLDLRSYERQGVDPVPTIHMGPVVTYLEQQGIRTEIGQYNEELKQFNRVLQTLKSRLASLKKWLAEAICKTAEIMKPEPYQPSLMEHIQVFQNITQGRSCRLGQNGEADCRYQRSEIRCEGSTFHGGTWHLHVAGLR